MFYLIVRRDRVDRSRWTVDLDEHLKWMRDRHLAGDVLLSGPSPDHTVGMYLVRAPDRGAAERVAGEDPITAAGLASFEIIEWDIRQALGFGPFSRAAIRSEHPADRELPSVAAWEGGADDRAG